MEETRGEHSVSLHGERAQRPGRHRQEAGRSDGHGGIALSGRWGGGYRWRLSKQGREREQRAAPEATARLVYQSAMEHTLTQSLPPFFPLSIFGCRSRPAPLAWMVAEDVALAPELGPLATEESPRPAVCQGLLIWAR